MKAIDKETGRFQGGINLFNTEAIVKIPACTGEAQTSVAIADVDDDPLLYLRILSHLEDDLLIVEEGLSAAKAAPWRDPKLSAFYMGFESWMP